MRNLTMEEVSVASGGDITWGDVGSALGGIAGSVGGIWGAAAGALAGKAVGEYFGCESTTNICNSDYLENLPTTYTN